MCPTHTVGSFFRRGRSTFFVHLLNNFEPQQLEPQKRVQNEKKKQNRHPQPRNHTKDPPMAPLFSALCDFFETFWIAPTGPPSFVSTFCNTMDVKKLQRVPPFTFFGTVTLFKNLIQNFFWKFFHVSPLIFLIFLQPAGVSQSPKAPPPFTILSLEYSADFGRSRLVLCSSLILFIYFFYYNACFFIFCLVFTFFPRSREALLG